MQPDFLIIPKVVHCNKKLRATDWIVYSVIYWFEHMKDGRCFASNQTIAEVSQVGERAVMAALERLEKQGYIKRIYDENKARRMEIQCLVKYSMVAAEKPAPVPENQLGLPGLPLGREETPGEFARRFFSGEKEAVVAIGKQLEESGVPAPMVVREMLKFKNYWTETNKSGKKQKWELQQTFDVKRRLGTWFRNIAERQSSGRRAGAGVTL